MTAKKEAGFIASLETNVEVPRTVAAIQVLVERFQAREFRLLYDSDGTTRAVRFTITDPHLAPDVGTDSAVFTVELAAPAEAIERALLRRRPGITSQVIRDRIKRQAQRVAWRQLHDIVRSSLIGVQSGLFTVGEVFLANLVVTSPTGAERRLGQLMTESHLLAPTGDGRLRLGSGS